MRYLLLFFFVQAEDGIRDGHVTGVQTCALPISTFHLPRGDLRRRLAYPSPGAGVHRGRYRSLLVEVRGGRARLQVRRRVEIGRASCRERMEVGAGRGAVGREDVESGNREVWVVR